MESRFDVADDDADLGSIMEDRELLSILINVLDKLLPEDRCCGNAWFAARESRTSRTSSIHHRRCVLPREAFARHSAFKSGAPKFFCKD
jgi:hypothetical protein